MSERTKPQVFTSVGDDGILNRPIGQPTYKKLREMRRDPTIKLARMLLASPILIADWSLEKTNEADPSYFACLEKEIKSLRQLIIAQAVYGCIDFGWQPFEPVFDFNVFGQTVVKKMKGLLQDKTKILVVKETGEYYGLEQEEEGEKVHLLANESVLANINVEGTNWYGEGLLQGAEQPYDNWKKVNEGATRYDEKMAGAHWVIHYPIGTSDYNGQVDVDNYEIAKQLIGQLKASGSIAVPRALIDHISADSLTQDTPDAWRIELVDSKGGHTSFIDRMKYLDALKVRAFGMPERSVLEGTFGTKAEAEAHADFAIAHMENFHGGLVTQINKQLIDALLTYNVGPDAKDTMYIVPSPIADPDREFLRTTYQLFIQADPTEAYQIDMPALRERLGLPKAPQMEMLTAPYEGEGVNEDVLPMPLPEETSYAV